MLTLLEGQGGSQLTGFEIRLHSKIVTLAQDVFYVVAVISTGTEILIQNCYAVLCYSERRGLCVLGLQTSLKHFGGSTSSFIFHELQKMS